MRNLGQTSNPIAQGLVALTTPLAQAGMQIGVSAQKADLNKARIAAGKQPCTGQIGQPLDCPSIFAPQIPGAAGPLPQQQAKGKTNVMLWVFLLGAAGFAAFMFMGGDKKD